MEHRRTKGSFGRDDLPKGITSIEGKQGQALMMLPESYGATVNGRRGGMDGRQDGPGFRG